jgi:hypothetical protein
LQPELAYDFRFPRCCRLRSIGPRSRFALAGQLVEGETFPDDLPDCHVEPLAVVQTLAVIVPEALFVQIPEKMERFHTYVRPGNPAL